jgi:hypothetical protein
MKYDEAIDMTPLLTKQKQIQDQINTITQQAQARLAPLQVQLNTLNKQIAAAQKAPGKENQPQNQPQPSTQPNQQGQQGSQQSSGLNPVSPVS